MSARQRVLLRWVLRHTLLAGSATITDGGAHRRRRAADYGRATPSLRQRRPTSPRSEGCQPPWHSHLDCRCVLILIVARQVVPERVHDGPRRATSRLGNPSSCRRTAPGAGSPSAAPRPASPPPTSHRWVCAQVTKKPLTRRRSAPAERHLVQQIEASRRQAAGRGRLDQLPVVPGCTRVLGVGDVSQPPSEQPDQSVNPRLAAAPITSVRYADTGARSRLAAPALRPLQLNVEAAPDRGQRPVPGASLFAATVRASPWIGYPVLCTDCRPWRNCSTATTASAPRVCSS